MTDDLLWGTPLSECKLEPRCEGVRESSVSFVKPTEAFKVPPEVYKGEGGTLVQSKDNPFYRKEER